MNSPHQNLDQAIDWSKTTFEGSRREQLRRWCALTLRQRLEALDELTDRALQMRSIIHESGARESVASASSMPTPAAQSGRDHS